MIQSPVSWAHVGREMILALSRRGCRMTVTPLKGLLYDPCFPVSPRLWNIMTRAPDGEVDLAFMYPPLYRRLQGKKKIGLLVYESSRLPGTWRKSILDYLNLLIVPSAFCADIMEENGIPQEMVRVVPYGYNPDIFFHRPDKKNEPQGKRPFTFLTIALPHRRKGLDLLIDAYLREFRAGEPVHLRIKLLYHPDAKKRRQRWEENTLEDFIRSHPSPPGERPDIEMMDDLVSPEKMAGVYHACDCYVQSSRSEGFGMALLEAAACGKPVIAGDRGGHRDFLGPDNAFLIRTSVVKAGEIQYDSRHPEATTFLPDISHLRKQMRYVYTHPEEGAAVARKAAETTKHLTWDHAAALLMQHISRVIS